MQEYIHRVGRTARAGTEGRALLFVLPTELGYLRYLKAARVELDEYEFPQHKIANVQSQVNGLPSIGLPLSPPHIYGSNFKTTNKIYVLCGLAVHLSAAGAFGGEELLFAQVSPRCLSVVPAGIRITLAQAHF